MDLALDVVRDRWGGRLVDRGFQTTPEEWTINGTRRSGEWSGVHRSCSHAWSAGQVQLLTHDLTGFEVLEPGCERVALDPTETEFAYDVDVPTPRGTISVEHREEEFAVTAPADVAVEAPADVRVEDESDG